MSLGLAKASPPAVPPLRTPQLAPKSEPHAKSQLSNTPNSSHKPFFFLLNSFIHSPNSPGAQPVRSRTEPTGQGRWIQALLQAEGAGEFLAQVEQY